MLHPSQRQSGGRLSSLFYRHPLWGFLPVQAALLFYNLDLLPVWGDEQFTLNLIARPWSEAFSRLRADIHPPLYFFLVRLWTAIPCPGSLIAQVRAFSSLWTLLATVLIYFVWLKDRPRAMKFWFLLLWTFSPVLVLYSRMARSYSMQLFLGFVLIHLALRMVQEPRNKKVLDSYPLIAALLLYTHYLPGLAIVAATITGLSFRWLRRRQPEVLHALLIPHFLIFLLYAPWLGVLKDALNRVAEKESYFFIDDWAGETALRLTYWFASFTFGETIPAWGIIAALLLAALVVWLAWEGASRSWKPALLVLIAMIGYIGASSWVAFPFVPARLLFLLPAYLLLLVQGRSLRPSAGSIICGGVLAVSFGSLWSYFHKTDFFNKGYLIPFQQISHQIKESSSFESMLVVVDRYNSDPGPFLTVIRDFEPYVVIDHPSKIAKVTQRLRQSPPEKIWYLRNTHDVSPGKLNEQLVSILQDGYRITKHKYLPYSQIQRWFLRQMGFRDPPTHYYEVLELDRSDD